MKSVAKVCSGVLLIVLLFVLSAACLAIAPAQAATPAYAGGHAIKCNPAALKKIGAKVFINPKNKSAWLSANKKMDGLFAQIGFTAGGKSKNFANTQVCSPKKSSSGIYFMQGQPYSFMTANECDEKLATGLGFQKGEVENFGSMEAGIPVTRREISVCTDGSKFTECDALTPEMQACLAEL